MKVAGITDLALVAMKVVDEVAYELYLSQSGSGGVIRVFDLGAGELVSVTKYDDCKYAKDTYYKTVDLVL